MEPTWETLLLYWTGNLHQPPECWTSPPPSTCNQRAFLSWAKGKDDCVKQTNSAPKWKKQPGKVSAFPAHFSHRKTVHVLTSDCMLSTGCHGTREAWQAALGRRTLPLGRGHAQQFFQLPPPQPEPKTINVFTVLIFHSNILERPQQCDSTKCLLSKKFTTLPCDSPPTCFFLPNTTLLLFPLAFSPFPGSE